MNNHQIQNFFTDYAQALASYDASKISSFYSVPMAVFSDQGNRAVTMMEEVTSFWKEGIEPYAAQHIKKAVPRIITESQLSDSIFTVEVRWSNYDEKDNPVSDETNYYILQQKDDGFRICGLILMTTTYAGY